MGAPDVMMLPLGAYEPRWFMAEQHMDPEQALDTWQVMEARYALPMHYGTFDLSDEPLELGLEEIGTLFEERTLDGRLLREQFIPLLHGESMGFAGGERAT